MQTDEISTRDEVTLNILSAFTDGGDGGNSAAVVLDADGLTEAQMQAIATEAGLSETAFVSAANGGFRLDFFTPTRRIADCGHATVAAFALLHSTGSIGFGETAKQIVDGRRKVTVTEDGSIFMEQREPRYRKPSSREGVGVGDLLTAFGISARQLDARVEPVIADAGGAFAMLALNEEDDLAALKPDQPQLVRISDALGLTGFYVFVLDPGRGRAATARMFAPGYGIPEESATGMAAGALGALLRDILHRRDPVFLIEQGRHMDPPSPSLLEVRASSGDGRATTITTGGRGVLRSARCVAVAG